MSEFVLDFLDVELADGDLRNVLRKLEEDDVLIHVVLGIKTTENSSPLSAYVALDYGETYLKILGGWVWSDVTHTHIVDLVWHGHLRIPLNTRLRLRGENNTGRTETIRCSYLMERA